MGTQHTKLRLSLRLSDKAREVQGSSGRRSAISREPSPPASPLRGYSASPGATAEASLRLSDKAREVQGPAESQTTTTTSSSRYSRVVRRAAWTVVAAASSLRAYEAAASTSRIRQNRFHKRAYAPSGLSRACHRALPNALIPRRIRTRSAIGSVHGEQGA